MYARTPLRNGALVCQLGSVLVYFSALVITFFVDLTPGQPCSSCLALVWKQINFSNRMNLEQSCCLHQLTARRTPKVYPGISTPG
jgi:hypothetical protein